MSSAQAAASAAFSGTKAPVSTSGQKRKPSFRINTNVATSQPKVSTPRAPMSADIGTPRLQSPPGPPTPSNSRRRSSGSGTKPHTRTTPGSGASFGSRAGPVSRRNSNINTPANGSTKPGQRSSKPPSAANDGTTGSVDYFSLPRSGSVSSQDLSCHTPRAKSPPSTRPQDMLDQVRQSINSKSKSGTSKDAVRKSQSALNEFRKSVDSRRLLSQSASLNGVSCDELYKETNPNPGSRQSSSGEIYNIAAASRSQSSVGSVISDTNSGPYINSGGDTSDISHHHLRDTKNNHNNDIVDDNRPSPTPNFRLSFCDTTSNSEISKKPSVVSSQDAPSPIPIPLSSQGVDRGLAANSSDSMAKLSVSPGNLLSPGIEGTGTGTGGESPDIPTKPGRKKPPGISYDSESLRDTSGSDIESVGVGIESSDIDTDESEGVKFPLFPGISKKSHRKGLFSKKKKQRDTGVVYDPEELQQDEIDERLAPVQSRSSKQLSNTSQPVKLRTTMRKEDKRKEKKTAFNEDKPWKNHGDLDVISDAQRKRYEGLWVSNKGLYLDRVITELVGVDCDRTEDPVLPKKFSERAAKLSASTNVDFDPTDIKELHGIDNVTTQNLIHGSVVKELWNRSNLPRETLQAIWELVDCRNDGTLNKAEFIVGMWLVDQCLYGRKLPKTVNKSVWSSLGGLGVNVVIKKKRR